MNMAWVQVYAQCLQAAASTLPRRSGNDVTDSVITRADALFHRCQEQSRKEDPRT